MLILSLMGPRVRSKYKNGSNILILMDTSAGMQHKDGDKTRFEKAVDEAVNTSGLNHRIENETFNFMVCDFPVRKLIEIHF